MNEAHGSPRAYAAPYELVVGVCSGEQQSHFATLKEVFRATFGESPEEPLSFTGYYGPEARLMLLIALRQGWEGAQEAYDYLMSYVGPDGVPMTEDLDTRSGWAIAPAAPHTETVMMRW